MRILGKWLGRLFFLLVPSLGAVFFFAPAYIEGGRNVVKPHDPYPVSSAAQTLHDDLIIGDWHADPLLWRRNLNQRGKRGQVDIPRLIEGKRGRSGLYRRHEIPRRAEL